MVFGEKISGCEYGIRNAVYAVIMDSKRSEVLIVRDSKGGYFLPGGGIENGENHQECLKREVLEEIGREICIENYIGEAEMYFNTTRNIPLCNHGYFYTAKILQETDKEILDRHDELWVGIKESKNLLVLEHHYWAVEKALDY